jgi:predicted membrane-bound mannosyltransferase
VKLDRDLERQRFWYRVAAGVNMALAFGQASQRNWFIALTAGLWALMCVFMARGVWIHQRTREQCRMVRAMMNAATEERAKYERGS